MVDASTKCKTKQPTAPGKPARVTASCAAARLTRIDRAGRAIAFNEQFPCCAQIDGIPPRPSDSLLHRVQKVHPARLSAA